MMKRIYKKISLENYKSRIPSVISAYNDDMQYNYTLYDYQSNNYGKIPSDIYLPNGMIPNTQIEIPILKNTNYIISFKTLSSWYSFFKKYYAMLSIETNCGVIEYPSAIDYYYNEINDQERLEEFKEYDNYFNQIGGKEMYEWITKYCIVTDKNVMSDNLFDYEDKTQHYDNITFNAYINIPIIITNNIKDLGMMSYLNEEWQPQTNFTSNIEGNGTIVTYNGDDWLKIKSNTKGNIYSPTYNEFYFGTISALTTDQQERIEESEVIIGEDKQWERNIQTYMKNHINEFSSINSNIPYSYNKNKLVFNPNILNMSDVVTFLAKENNINYLIDNNVYQEFICDYIYYNNKYYKVYNINYKTQENVITTYSYVKIANKKYYASYDTDIDNFFILINDKKYYINFNSNNNYEIKTFIEINNNIYVVTNHTVVINTNNQIKKYYSFFNYFKYNNKYYYLNNGLNTIKFNCYANNNNILEYKIQTIITDIGERITDKNISNDKNGYYIQNQNIYIVKPYTIYNFAKLKGITESKLELLQNLNKAFDDMGNELPGSVEIINGVYKPITEKSMLDINFSVGAVNNMEVINEITSDLDVYYWGNIITEIEISDGVKTLQITDNQKSIIAQIKEYFGDYKSNLHCKVTYYIGAIIKKWNNNYILAKDYWCGVKYIDEFTLEKKTTLYYKDNYNSFEIYYYDLIYDEIIFSLNEYNNYICNVRKSTFEYYINIIDENGRSKVFIYDTNLPINPYNEENGFNALPVFRQPYQIGISVSQSVISDVDIDRGIATFYEKHFKLLETKTLASLLNYGNGQFNIINN